ncbi:MAG: glycosyltransferase [Bryobacterales bacterium]|nr:glycosyltransferase [Bryobacterales bacterium]
METYSSPLKGNAALSVVLIVPNHRDTVLRTITHLRAQSLKERIEILLFGPTMKLLETLRDDLAPFAGFQLVQWGNMRNMAAARGEGFRLARSPLLAHAEDHCFPEPGWAEALVAAFEPDSNGNQPAAAGPLMVNENARTLWSWAAFTLHFSHAAFRETRGPAQYVATHNTCFRKDAVLALGEALDSGIEMEMLLQDRLRAAGHTLSHEANAVTRHVNVSRPVPLLRASFYGGWLFSTVRMREEGWGLGRKLFQLAASPLVPLLQLKRRWSALGRIAGERRLLPWIAFPVLAITTVHTVGEIVGILFPRDAVIEDYSNFENTRMRFVRPEERHLLAPPGEEISAGHGEAL